MSARLRVIKVHAPLPLIVLGTQRPLTKYHRQQLVHVLMMQAKMETQLKSLSARRRALMSIVLELPIAVGTQLLLMKFPQQQPQYVPTLPVKMETLLR